MDILSILIGVIISSIVTAISSESIIKGIGQLLTKIDLPKSAVIEGTWIAEFSISESGQISTYSEAIKIIKRLGIIYGYNIPHEKNHELLKKVEEKKPMRLKGNMIDNRFFTGVWFHPNRKSRYHGSYQLLLELSGSKLTGTWTGYSESQNQITSGSWIWNKID